MFHIIKVSSGGSSVCLDSKLYSPQGVVEIRHSENNIPTLYHPLKRKVQSSSTPSSLAVPDSWHKPELKVQLCTCNDRRLLQQTELGNQQQSSSRPVELTSGYYSSRPSQRCKKMLWNNKSFQWLTYSTFCRFYAFGKHCLQLSLALHSGPKNGHSTTWRRCHRWKATPSNGQMCSYYLSQSWLVSYYTQESYSTDLQNCIYNQVFEFVACKHIIEWQTIIIDCIKWTSTMDEKLKMNSDYKMNLRFVCNMWHMALTFLTSLFSIFTDIFQESSLPNWSNC